MGGKSSTSTSQVTVPPDVLARYDSINAQAQQTAATPFQPYTGQFVAPVNNEQTGAISSINTAAQQAQPYYGQAENTLNSAQASAQPYYGASSGDITAAQGVGSGLAGSSLTALQNASGLGAGSNAAAGQDYSGAYAGAQPYQMGATGLALAGGQAVNPNNLNINQYLSPYLQDVLGSEAGVLNQNNQQQQAGQLGNAITSGAFGGDRAGIAAANLEQQQNLANANIYSGILNQGFNTALGAAQQQQGVQLGASQANRAALQEAAGQIQGIGQQGYEQGMGLGSATQGLGQQQYAQGANTAAQEAALGNQQFGQGLAASQQQSALGQAVYGTGAATSAALANLGTSAQTAAEQGAAAQLQAGTLQQQTAQAQDTAQYNQFLQQQSYPFQVDQFLANIAEGTGALSGSTTTSTTPGSLFSDERLKEDIEPIGKTYDGQNIVAFRYKGDKTKRIGLIAQDVEKKHPDAVGLAGGFKTVDYDKATEDAAKRGHFKSGGLAGANDNRNGYAFGGMSTIPGITQYDLSNLIGQQQQMYAPFSGAGLYGGGLGGGVRGGSSYVPQANLPVSHLAVANAPTVQQQNPLQTAKQVADFATNSGVQQGFGKIAGLFGGSSQSGLGAGSKPLSDDSGGQDVDDLASALGMLQKGGRVRRDTGGQTNDDPNVYTDATTPIGGPGLGIPEVTNHNQLATANTPKPQGDGGIFGDILGIAKDVIPFIPGLAGGGRAHRDDGGALLANDPTDPLATVGGVVAALTGLASNAGLNAGRGLAGQHGPTPTADAATPAPIPAVDSMAGTGAGATSLGLSPGTGGGRAPGVGLAAAIRPETVTNSVGGLSPDAIVPPGTPTSGGSPVISPSIPPTALAGVGPTAVPKVTDATPVALPTVNKGLGAATTPSQAQPSTGGLGGIGQTLEHGAEGALGGIGHFLSNPNNLPSILAGLAAWTGAPTRNPITALAQGLGAGAQTYMANQQQRAQIAQTQAQAGLTQAEAAHTTAITNADMVALAKSGFVPQEDPNGPYLLNGKRYSFVKGMLNTATMAPGSSATGQNYSYLGDAGARSAAGAYMNYGVAPPADQAASRSAMNDVQQKASDARSQLPQLIQFAQTFDPSARGGLQSGPLNTVKMAWVSNFNDVARSMGLPGLQIDPSGADAATIADKMNIVTAQARAQGANQQSLGALETLQHSVPNNTMSPTAASDMVMQAMVRNQRDIDRANYYNEYNQAAQSNGAVDSGFLARDAEQSFGSDHTADQYNHEQERLTQSLENGSFQKINTRLQSDTPEQRAHDLKALDAVTPGFHRYFTGGQ